MAIDPVARFPEGTEDPGTAGRPFGEARNVSVPGATDGFPWDASYINDIYGFLHSLLDSAGVVPDNSVDEVGNSQYFSALTSLVAALAAGAAEVPADREIDTGFGLNGGGDLSEDRTLSVDLPQLLAEHLIHTGGLSQTAQLVTGSSVTPVVSDTNIYLLRPTGGVNTVSVGNPLAAETVPGQSQVLTFIIEFANTSQSVNFDNGTFGFVDGSPLTVSRADFGPTAVVQAFYDPADNTDAWKLVNLSKSPEFQQILLDGTDLNFTGSNGQRDFSVDLSSLAQNETGDFIGFQTLDVLAAVGGSVPNSGTRTVTLNFPLNPPVGQDIVDPTNYFIRHRINNFWVNNLPGPGELGVETELRGRVVVQAAGPTGPNASMDVIITYDQLGADGVLPDTIRVDLYRLRGPF